MNTPVLHLPAPELKRANNANFLEFYAQLYTLSEEIIPRLKFHSSFKVASRGCNEKYTLHYSGMSNVCRVFQLEVYDRFYPSHRDKDSGTQWYGPIYTTGESRGEPLENLTAVKPIVYRPLLIGHPFRKPFSAPGSTPRAPDSVCDTRAAAVSSWHCSDP